MEHRKDELPVTFRGSLVEDVSVWKSVAVLDTLVDLVRVADVAGLQQIAKLLDH